MELNSKLLRGINTSKGQRQLMSWLGTARSEQSAPATAASSLMTGGIIESPGRIGQILLINSNVAGAGESMVFDLLLNGASILTATYTLNTASGTGKIDLTELFTNDVVLNAGDVLRVSRTYVAGAGTMGSTSLVVHYAPEVLASELAV